MTAVAGRIDVENDAILRFRSGEELQRSALAFGRGMTNAG